MNRELAEHYEREEKRTAKERERLERDAAREQEPARLRARIREELEAVGVEGARARRAASMLVSGREPEKEIAALIERRGRIATPVAFRALETIEKSAGDSKDVPF